MINLLFRLWAIRKLWQMIRGGRRTPPPRYYGR
jgi:hypothetical protein